MAVITGCASGLGAATAHRLRAEGIRVAGLDLRPAAEADLAIEVDVRDAEAVEAAVGRAERELGPVDHLLTAAGVYELLPLGGIGEERWRRMLAIHVGGTANACRSAYLRMRARRRGSIVTIGSELGLIGDPEAAHYAAAKGAIHAFTKSLALEAIRHGVRANCVAPGPADTPMLKPEMRPPAYVASLPLGRVVRPEEVAETVTFLLVEEHGFLGAVLSPNAGAVV
ncbi:MAG TPA: SDR family oxidoreductase [Actinomycetota bacterium]|nr:SDR family oxidoreductase [Actinomycetota bacterium]